MNRPLLISDCDEVLFHMVRHFAEWVEADHGIDFPIHPEVFTKAMRYRHNNELVPRDEMMRLVDVFFETEMHRQTLVPHAVEALSRIGKVADIVILTNLPDQFHPHRVSQLEAVGIKHEVICNQGGKGRAVARILEARQPSVTAFVDDVAAHHDSVARRAPEVWRVHLMADPDFAPLIAPAPDAHIRIDDWNEAADWILDKFVQ
jgi:hypothetical protein